MTAVFLRSCRLQAYLELEVASNRLVDRSIWGAVTTAPPKPSVQTQFVLSRMDSLEKRVEERWDQVMASLDLLFAKVEEVEVNQQKTDTRVEMSTKVMEQMLKDQQLLAKQMEVTGQAVAKLTLAQMENQRALDSPTSSENSFENRVPQFQPRGQNHHRPPNFQRREDSDRFQPRNLIPKMAFPKLRVRIHAFGETSVKTISSCLIFLLVYGLPWLLSVWRAKQQSGCMCTSRNMSWEIGTLSSELWKTSLGIMIIGNP